MTEEEYFRKNFPDFCYGDKPLSPHWDFFQEGVEFGERESEKKIAELEQKLEQTEKDLADYQFNYPTIKELQKENAELKGLKDVATLIRANNDTVVTLMQLNNKLVSKSQQLIKAKELLKRCYENYIYLEPLRSEIKQFISEVEK